MFKRVVALFAAALGVLGVVACAWGGSVVYQAEARLQQANDRAFALLDRGLGFVEDRVRRVQARVRDAKITTDEIRQKLTGWTKLEAKERFVTRLEIGNRTEKLAAQLQAADAWLEASAESVNDARDLLVVGQSLGTRLDPAALDEVIGHITSARGKVQEAEEVVGEVRAFALGKEGEPDQARIARVVKVLARILATVTEADALLARCAERLAERRTDARELKARTSRQIWRGAIVCYVVLAWAALGQVALCWWGLRGCCRRRDREAAGGVAVN
jgi:hypothetical protein